MIACVDAYNLGLPDPNKKPFNAFEPFQRDGRWYTKCNEAFNFVAKRMGYHGFDLPETTHPSDAQLAAVMYSRMVDPAGDWRIVTAAAGAQELANMGSLVAAIFENPHGTDHVATVFPGLAEWSSSWGGLAPILMNVGSTVFIGKKASLAFRKEEMPRYFTLKEAA